MARSISAQSADNARRIDQGQAAWPIRDPNLATGTGYSGGAWTGTPTSTTPTPSNPTSAATAAKAPTPWTPYSAPGVGENYWAQNGSQWQQPGASSNYWNGVQGWFANPTAQETNVQQYGQTVGSTPGALENLYGQYNGSGQFTNPGQSEQWYAQNGDAYNQPGAMEQFYGQNASQLAGNNNLADHQGGIASDINSARNTGAFFGATASDLARPGYAESLANRFDPSARTYNEQFLLGGGATEGLDSLYSRLTSQGSRRLDDAAAARGGFNSGASLRAQEELGADMNAQHVRDYMQASQAADASAGDYRNYGLGVTSNADAGLRGRIGLGLQGAQAADSTALGRANAAQGLYTGVSDELRSNLGLAGDWAQQSQGDALSRLNSGSAAATAAQNAENQRVTTGLGAAGATQNSWLDRYRTAAGLDSNAQSMALDRINAGGNLAASAGNEDLQRLAGGFNAANAAQTMGQNRENSVYDNLLRSAQAQGGAYSGGMDQIRKEQAQQFADQINGQLRSGQITAEQIQAKYGAQMQSLGLIMQFGQLVASGGMSGAVPGGGGQAQPPAPPSYYGRPAIGPGGPGNDTLPISF